MLYKLKNKTTESFTRALEDYVTHVGCPQKLTCDNGSEFCSELVDAVVKVLGIKKRTSVVYRPQSQGMVERMNRQIIAQLTKRLKQFGGSWPEHLHYIALAHNAAPASRTGESPNLVFFGRELPLPTFTDHSINTLRNKSVKEYAEQVQRKVKAIHEAVKAESIRQSEKTAQLYNKKVKHHPYKEGDHVYYKQIPKNRTKIDPRWLGPVRVTHRHPSAQGQPGTTYTLQMQGGETLRRNYEQLKPVRADFSAPMAREDLPAPRAPSIPYPMILSSDEGDAHTSWDLPVAARTRSKKAQVATIPPPANLPATPAPAEPMPSHITPGTRPPRGLSTVLENPPPALASPRPSSPGTSSFATPSASPQRVRATPATPSTTAVCVLAEPLPQCFRITEVVRPKRKPQLRTLLLGKMCQLQEDEHARRHR